MGIKFVKYFSFRFRKNQNFYGFSYDINELIYILKGKGTIEISSGIGSQKYEYCANSLIAISRKVKRTQITLEPTDYMCIGYIETDEKKNHQSMVYRFEDEEVLRLFLELKNEYARKRYRYYEYCNFTISQILIVLERMAQMENDQKDIYTMIQYIDESKGLIKSIKEMARETAYSYDHFRHKFKQITGQSPTDYIMNKRIENACCLLEEGGYNCTEVSILCGFSSPAQFSNIFKKKMGISPKNIKNTL